MDFHNILNKHIFTSSSCNWNYFNPNTALDCINTLSKNLAIIYAFNFLIKQMEEYILFYF